MCCYTRCACIGASVFRALQSGKIDELRLIEYEL